MPIPDANKAEIAHFCVHRYTVFVYADWTPKIPKNWLLVQLNILYSDAVGISVFVQLW